VGYLSCCLSFCLSVIDVTDMKLFFVLGSSQGLSAAEISAVTGLTADRLESAGGGLLLAEFPDSQAASAGELMSRLGGTVKIGRVIIRPLSPESLAENLRHSGLTRPEFGVSDHSLGHQASRRERENSLKGVIRLGMETKRLLKEAGISSRFVRPQDGVALSSAAVEKNNLLERGGEFVIIADPITPRFGRTEAVQPFEEFSHKDYGRPARDARQGMLPPKLARIMLNLARVGRKSSVWDPFCGSGTVLTEAMQLGATGIYGSDINPKAVSDSRENVDWFLRSMPPNFSTPEVWLSVGDARQPPPSLRPGSLDAIVSEVFLGAPRTGREGRGELIRRLNEIALLVEQSLSAWKRLLSPQASLVLALPAYVEEEAGRTAGGLPLMTEIHLPSGYRWQPVLPEKLAGQLRTGLTPTKGGLIYGRPGQMVWREIVKISLAR
jgi:tRNA G10  N-methylase Trm11